MFYVCTSTFETRQYISEGRIAKAVVLRIVAAFFSLSSQLLLLSCFCCCSYSYDVEIIPVVVVLVLVHILSSSSLIVFVICILTKVIVIFSYYLIFVSLCIKYYFFTFHTVFTPTSHYYSS